MSLIRLNNLTKEYENKPILREIFFRLDEKDHVGLIGKNGSGKTTLLRLILGQEEPTNGSLEIQPGIKIGYFSQFSELNGAQTVLQIADAVFNWVHQIEESLLEIEIAIEERPPSLELDRLLLRQSQWMDEMQHLGGWNYQNKIDTVLSRLGFSEQYRNRPIHQLSGGWRNRAALVKILLEEPDVLLMDEPTNFLDLEGLTWLEEWFTAFRGGLIVVSHDRHFLDRVTNRIVEIENLHFQEYQGNFTNYIRQKPLRMKTLERQFEHEAELLAIEAEAITDRQDALRNPSMTLKRRLANIKKETKPRLVDKIITDIYQNLYVPADLLQVLDLSKAYGDELLFKQVNLEVHRGDRIAILGPNGCGKTTLLRALMEDETPDTGSVSWSKSASFASFNQIFNELDMKDSVSHAVNVTDLGFFESRKAVNRFLGLMQFSELDLHQRIGTLSGGQRARVALAKALLSGASTLLLDEPTNHLDLTSTQVMERAIVGFPGAVIVVSHDRFFIDKIATRLLVFEGHGHVREVNGNWSIWQSAG